MSNQGGFILLLTLVFMVVLTALVGALVFMVTYETRDVAIQADDAKLLNLAEAGVQRALRAIRDDVLTFTQTGVADLRGNTTSGTAGNANQRNRVRYFNESGGTLSIDASGDGTYVILSDLDLNYLGTRIKNVSIGCRYCKSSGGGNNPSLEILYTTDGAFPQAGNSSFTTVVSSSSYNAEPYIVLDITADRAWTWSIINSPDFQIRAFGFNSNNRNVQTDYLFLQVTYEIDTNTEPWHTGSYDSFPISLGGGTIESISIADEAAKAHLNYASQTLLRYLMEERGIASGTADALATDIVAYRSGKFFDSVAELQQVTGMTSAYYDLIKDYVTVYSFINTSATRPSGSRAPININTASQEVLEAVFDALSLGAGDAASLATDIISTRASAPFTCFYSSDSAVTTDFYDFVTSRAYLSTSGNPSEQDRVLDSADASPLVPIDGSADYDNPATEFCYDGNAFKVESLADIQGRGFRVKTVLGDDGSHTFATFIGDTTNVGYRQENFE
jgi:DNA uptake protein ComE-like DNA-binding protein/Tfp pilus assembly protein PilX